MPDNKNQNTNTSDTSNTQKSGMRVVAYKKERVRPALF